MLQTYAPHGKVVKCGISLRRVQAQMEGNHFLNLRYVLWLTATGFWTEETWTLFLKSSLVRICFPNSKLHHPLSHRMWSSCSSAWWQYRRWCHSSAWEAHCSSCWISLQEGKGFWVPIPAPCWAVTESVCLCSMVALVSLNIPAEHMDRKNKLAWDPGTQHLPQTCQFLVFLITLKRTASQPRQHNRFRVQVLISLENIFFVRWCCGTLGNTAGLWRSNPLALTPFPHSLVSASGWLAEKDKDTI